MTDRHYGQSQNVKNMSQFVNKLNVSTIAFHYVYVDQLKLKKAFKMQIIIQGDTISHLVKQFLPVVLCHESEEGQKSPAEGIKTGVAIVWIPSYFQAVKSVGTLPAMDKQLKRRSQSDYGMTLINKGYAALNQRQLGRIQLCQRAGCFTRVKKHLQYLHVALWPLTLQGREADEAVSTRTAINTIISAEEAS